MRRVEAAVPVAITNGLGLRKGRKGKGEEKRTRIDH